MVAYLDDECLIVGSEKETDLFFAYPGLRETKGSNPNGSYISPDSATTIPTQGVRSLDAAQRNPGIGVMVKHSPYFAALHAGYV